MTESEVAEVRRKYAAGGYELYLPDDIRGLSRQDLELIASGVVRVLDRVYRRDPDLSAERTHALLDDVSAGRILLFVLVDSARSVVATTAFVEIEQVFPGSEVGSYEAGRTAKLPSAPPRVATDLLRTMSLWAQENLRESDYLVAHARVAGAQAGRPYNGAVLARALAHKDFVATYAAYSNYVAQTAVEPFVWGFAPTNPEAWLAATRRQTVHLAGDAESRLLGAMLAESCAVQVRHAESGLGSPLSLCTGIRELSGPSTTIESLYVLTGRPLTSRPVLAEIPGIVLPDGTRASAGLSDRVVVEADVVSRTGSVRVLAALRRQGFGLAGWAPSNLDYGRLALVLTRPGTVADKGVTVAPPDLSALAHFPATHRFLTHVLSRRPFCPAEAVTQTGAAGVEAEAEAAAGSALPVRRA